jgi:hypothetical protein
MKPSISNDASRESREEEYPDSDYFDNCDDCGILLNLEDDYYTVGLNGERYCYFCTSKGTGNEV